MDNSPLLDNQTSYQSTSEIDQHDEALHIADESSVDHHRTESHGDKAIDHLNNIESSHSVTPLQIVSSYDHSNLNTMHMSIDRSINLRRSLYLSYWFASFGDRAWEFASVISIVELFPTSLVGASVFGLIETSINLLGSPIVGGLIDRSQRLTTVKISVIGQNAVMALACVVFYIAFTREKCDQSINHCPSGEEVDQGLVLYLSYGILIICACLIKLSSTMNKISLHKDWTPCIANSIMGSPLHHQSTDQTLLSQMNASMRRVDLTNSVIAPLAFGVLSSMTSSTVGVICLGLWSVVSLFIELLLCQRIWDHFPSLHVKEYSTSNNQSINRNESMASTFARSAQTYWNSPVFGASLAYCLLYVSLLNFGGIMTAFLASDGMRLSEALVAGGRALGALIGISATFITPKLIQKFGLVSAGSISLTSQLACVCVTEAAFLFIDSMSRDMFIVLLFGSLSASRFGLWAFDLVETEQMQMGIALSEAGVVNGAQESLTNFAYLLSFGITIVFSDPADFVYPASISFGAVVLASIIYLKWANNPSNPFNQQVSLIEPIINK